jgi:pimeloyl-ACP methyl ester carboxylesterase
MPAVPLPASVPSTDGVDLPILDLGGDGPLLLCSHATGFHGMVWRPMARALAPRWHSVAWDYRAHGDAPPPASGHFEWVGFGQDASAVAAALGAPGLVAVGHSMGGAALLMAELARPGTFRALVLFEPIVFPPPPPGEAPPPPTLAAGARRRRSSYPSYEAAIENFSGKPPLNVFTPDALDAYVRHGFREGDDGHVHLKCLPEHEARTYEMASHHRVFERLGEVGCPVLVLAGRDDESGPPAIAPAVAAGIPGSSFVRLGSVGHFGPMEDPELVAGQVDAFLSSHR